MVAQAIIVCCHAIWLGGPTNGHDQAEWAIEPFQYGETPTLIEHVTAGLRILQEQPDSLLIFSGAATKTNKTRVAEAESYLNLALANNLFSYSVSPARIVTEVHSTDSYQNLLFSLLRFRTITSSYPTHVTIISHEFKRERFLKLHCRAIRWPVERVTYVGINPPEEVTPAKELIEGEILRGRGAWEQDLYGTGITLRQKREKRGWRGDPDERVIIEGLEDDIWGLMRWEGGKSGSEVYAGNLPWGNLPQ